MEVQVHLETPQEFRKRWESKLKDPAVRKRLREGYRILPLLVTTAKPPTAFSGEP